MKNYLITGVLALSLITPSASFAQTTTAATTKAALIQELQTMLASLVAQLQQLLAQQASGSSTTTTTDWSQYVALPVISITDAEADFDTYSATPFTTNGSIIQLIPPNDLNPTYMVRIKDPSNASDTAYFDVATSTYGTLSIGESLQVTGELRGGFSISDRYIDTAGYSIKAN